MEHHVTIAGIVTPLMESGIGILRLSGPEALSLAQKLFHAYGNKPMESHRAILGQLKDERGNPLDEALVLPMMGPRSFTGEDTVEFHCHGNPYILKELLKALLRLGARKSEAGEFTKRAFLNGRLDLTQSEAILDTIQANNKRALSMSLSQMEGALTKTILRIRENLMGTIGYLEATVDFPDDEIEDCYTTERLHREIEAIASETAHLLSTYETGKIIREGLLTVLVGRPNAGKSSLLNALLGEDRAIITEHPGTTRDAIVEQGNIGELVLNIADTAGFRETSDPIETLGIQKTYGYIGDAQLVLFLVDARQGLTPEDEKMLNHLHALEKKYLILFNKSDLLSEVPENTPEQLHISAKTGHGLEAVKVRIHSLFLGEIREDYAIGNLRYYEILTKAQQSLTHFLAALENGQVPYDLLSIDLREAWLSLSAITGEDYSEDLLESIFSRFCIGK